MITTAAKLWLGIAGLAAAALVAYELASAGDWFGSFLLGSVVLVAGFLGVIAVLLRDSDVDAAEADPEVPSRRSAPAAWPALAAVGGGVAIVGLASHDALLYAGIGIVGAVFIEWMVQGWAERASADPAYNHALRHRIMSPFEIPALAAIVIAVFLGSLSRVLLALPETSATVVAIVVASLILLVGSVLAARPKIGSSVLAGIVALGAVLLIGAGIAGGVHGERKVDEPAAHESTTETTTPTSTTAATP